MEKQEFPNEINSIFSLVFYAILKEGGKERIIMSSSIEENANAKWLVTLLTIVAMAVGAVIWDTNEHSEIRSWTADQDFVTKKELKEVMKERYVPLSEYIELRTRLEYLVESSKKIEQRLEIYETKRKRKSSQRQK